MSATSATNQEPSNQDILNAVNSFSTATNKRLNGIDGRFDGMDVRIDRIEKRLDKIEATMVTKEYLDEKMQS